MILRKYNPPYNQEIQLYGEKTIMLYAKILCGMSVCLLSSYPVSYSYIFYPLTEEIER